MNLHLSNPIKKTVTLVASLLLVMTPATSIISFADDPGCNAPASSSPGVHRPTGAEASMFTYRCDGPYQGLWASDHYTFDPATSITSPINPKPYTYNQSTGKWDTQLWDYSAAKNAYVLDDLSVTTPPTGATLIGGPKANNASSASPSPASATNPNNNITNNGDFNTTTTNKTSAALNNGVLSYAGTGDAVASNNTNGGSASSGNAQAISTIINKLQSSANVLGGPNMVTFTADINGDVNGDLLLDPAKLGAVQPANVTNNLDNTVTVNNSTDAAINNDINLKAKSGNATVSNNTNGGDATSGSATAVANIVNTLNSAVTAGQSFMGVININGNLNGDILLPPNFVDTLLANNVPHYTMSTNELNNRLSVSNQNNASINNDVQATADSGNAMVSNNTNGGSASTGAANTDLTVFNLTGSSLVASNDLLVFINAHGNWYGMILNAPAGSTAASLGGGVSKNTINNTETLNNKTNQSINNKINVGAKSGDATVANNTKAGNAKSGDAKASVNLLNLIDDRLTLNGWFGLLFINVNGTWNGSFGVNTAAGDPIKPTTTSQQSAAATSPAFQFVPKAPAAAATSNATSGSGSGSASASTNDGRVLAASTAKQNLANTSSPTLATSGKHSYLVPIISVIVAFAILLATERQRILKRK